MNTQEIKYLRTFIHDDLYLESIDSEYHNLLIRNFNIKLEFKVSSEDFIEFYAPEEFLKNDSYLSKVKLTSVKLRKVVGYELYIEQIVNDKEDINLSFELYMCLKIFWKNFKYIPDFKWNIDDCYSYGCPATDEFEITIANKLEQNVIEFIKKLEEELINYNTFKVVNFLIPYYKIKNKDFVNYKVSETLSPNTKARRLGYLSMILELFDESDYYPIYYFSHKVEQQAESINNFLSKYENDKGIINISKKGTGISAKPYINLAEDLSLITNLNRSYILTKHGKIYRAINTQLKKNEFITQRNLKKENPFRLNLFEKSFFLHYLLLNDTLYFWSLIEMIYVQEGGWLKDIKKEFQKYILHELNQETESYNLSNVSKKKILHISQRIRKWRKPDKYLPHIIEPHINWFLDLGLLDSQAFYNKCLKFSKSGNRLFEILISFYDIFLEKAIIADFIIENHFFQIINEIYELNYRKYRKESAKQIECYIEESFKYFKTIAPKSISASQAICYVCYKSLLKDNCIIEFSDVKAFLETNTNFSIIWYEREKDGSLQKRR